MTPVPRGRPYADPYVAGVGLGLVLLAAFVTMGHGLGASGGFGNAAAGLVAAVSPEQAQRSPLLARYLDGPGGPWRHWLTFELVGVALGGALSALAAGRLRREIERGPRIGKGARLAYSFAGGGVMGVGAVLARGCTSGQALTGGALLSVGSWLFMGSAFASGYLVAPVMRKAWR